MLLIINNRDSFFATLRQLFIKSNMPSVTIDINDKDLANKIANLSFTHIALAPSLLNKDDFIKYHYILDILSKNYSQLPLLAIASGAFILADYLGEDIRELSENQYAKPIIIEKSCGKLFTNIPDKITVASYSSYKVNSEKNIKTTACDKDNNILAFQDKKLPWHAILFNPESILTENSQDILKNFLTTEHLINNKISGRIGQLIDSLPLNKVLEHLAEGNDLDQKTAKQLFKKLMNAELTNAQAATVLTALRIKGEAATEISAASEVVLEKALSFPNELKNIAFDVVGTGGDNKNTFNCSTATALALAAMKIPVIKHGNRSISSRSGSADVLEQLGFAIDEPIEKMQEDFQKNSFMFIYAPKFHPAFKNIMPVRREITIRTIFNIIGPLVNPALPKYRLIGVANKKYLKIVAGALVHIGNTKSAVIHGAGGYDELTPLGKADVIIIQDKDYKEMTIDPQQLGIKPCQPQDLTVDGPKDAAQVLLELLSGRGKEAMLDMLCLNISLALYLYNQESLEKNFNIAKDFILQGKAQRILEHARIF